MMSDTQRMTVDGTYNFRAVGGRSAGVYRSDALHRLSRAGRQQLRSLEIATVIDLRSQIDRRLTGRDRLRGTDARLVRVPIATGSPAADLRSLTLAGIYRTILTTEGGAVAEALRFVAQTDGPVVVHCTAGKDRTGLVSALALSVAGATREEVVADYARTTDNLAGPWSRRMLRRVRLFRVPITPSLVEVLTAAPPAIMTETLEWLDREHGGVASYLAAQGMSDAELAALRRRFVTPE